MMDGDEKAIEKWKYVFDTFTRQTLRDILYRAAYTLRSEDGEQRVVIEFSDPEDGDETPPWRDTEYAAMDITSHVETLEDGI